MSWQHHWAIQVTFSQIISLITLKTSRRVSKESTFRSYLLGILLKTNQFGTFQFLRLWMQKNTSSVKFCWTEQCASREKYLKSQTSTVTFLVRQLCRGNFMSKICSLKTVDIDNKGIPRKGYDFLFHERMRHHGKRGCAQWVTDNKAFSLLHKREKTKQIMHRAVSSTQTSFRIVAEYFLAHHVAGWQALKASHKTYLSRTSLYPRYWTGDL